MNALNQKRRILGATLFLIGISLALIFNGLAIVGDLNGADFWGDPTQAMLFDKDEPTEARLARLDCPILITTGNHGTITAAIANTMDTTIQPTFRAYVSAPRFPFFREITDKPSMDPGKTRAIRWAVTPEDRVEGGYIFVRTFLYHGPFPSRTASCGILVLDLPGFSGNLITTLYLAVSLLCLAFGGVLLSPKNRLPIGPSRRAESGLGILAIVMLAGTVANLAGWWILAGLLFLFTLLMMVSILQDLLSSS